MNALVNEIPCILYNNACNEGDTMLSRVVSPLYHIVLCMSINRTIERCFKRLSACDGKRKAKKVRRNESTGKENAS